MTKAKYLEVISCPKCEELELYSLRVINTRKGGYQTRLWQCDACQTRLIIYDEAIDEEGEVWSFNDLSKNFTI